MASRYWIGGTGLWTDNSHWSSVSGGAGGSSYPDSNTSDVFFDANSGLAGGSAITVNNDRTVNNFTWTAAFGTLVGVSGVNLWVDGDFLINSTGMVWQMPEIDFSSSHNFTSNVDMPNCYIYIDNELDVTFNGTVRVKNIEVEANSSCRFAAGCHVISCGFIDNHFTDAAGVGHSSHYRCNGAGVILENCSWNGNSYQEFYMATGADCTLLFTDGATHHFAMDTTNDDGNWDMKAVRISNGSTFYFSGDNGINIASELSIEGGSGLQLDCDNFTLNSGCLFSTPGATAGTRARLRDESSSGTK